MLEFALDLTWVRHKIVGGTESFVNNLITGFSELEEEFLMILIVTSDNKVLFDQYCADKRITLFETSYNGNSIYTLTLFRNFRLAKIIKNRNIRICLEPVYGKPLFGTKGIKYLTVIHDLQALHYPEFFSIASNIWQRIVWRSAINSSDHIISISDYVKKDIITTFHQKEESITTIYDPIYINNDDVYDFSKLQDKYGINERSYYYTVSKLNRHKNLDTLIKTFGEIKKREIEGIPCKLVISGINGNMEEELRNLAGKHNLLDEIVITGFVENSVRNALYKHAKEFLFPSIFEGFGMPPIEAMYFGTQVITTKATCIPEITQGLATYVEDPYSPDEWIRCMQLLKKSNLSNFNVNLYNPMGIAKQYLQELKQLQGDRQ